MTVLPIVERELRVASRRRGTYWNRTVTAGLAIALFALMFALGAADPNRDLGKQLFVVLSVCFLAVSLLTGVVYTADCLSEEKRDGTLGLLFLTDLRGYDVVLGKLVASSVGAVYATLAILPVLAIPLLLGGVSAAEFGRVVLVLVNTLFLSLAAGVMVSSMMRHSLAAMAVTLAVVVAANSVGPLLSVWIGYQTGTAPPEPLLVPSVGYACAVAHDPIYLGRAESFAISLAITQGLAWMFLVVASGRTRRSWQEGGTGRGMIFRREQWARWLRGAGPAQHRWRAAALEVNPCYWLAGRLRYKAWVVWVGLGVLGLLWLAGYAEWQEWSNDPGVALMTVVVMHTMLRWWLAGEATMGLGPDKRSGALELILCTDLSVLDIARGRLLGLQRQFFWPSVAVLVVDFWMLSVVLSGVGGDTEEWTGFFLALMLIFVLDLPALAWLGFWWGVTCRQPSRAFLRSVGLIFGLPWALLLGLMVLVIFFRVEVPEPEWIWLLATYTAVCSATSLLAWFWAREQVLQRLRTTAAGTGPIPTPTPPGQNTPVTTEPKELTRVDA